MTVPETSVPEESRDVPRAVGGGAATAPLLEWLDRLRDALLQRLAPTEPPRPAPTAVAPDCPASVGKLDPHDPGARGILMEVQTLKNDVRRRAKGKKG